MKVAILAGGLGSRLVEETRAKFRALVEIGGRPILWHLLRYYRHFGFSRFVIALGYKGHTKTATKEAPWGRVCWHGLLDNRFIVFDVAGQLQIGDYAPCWVHVERLVYNLIPYNDLQHRAVDPARRLIWWFYAFFKASKRDPRHKRAAQLRTRFYWIFQC